MSLPSGHIPDFPAILFSGMVESRLCSFTDVPVQSSGKWTWGSTRKSGLYRIDENYVVYSHDVSFLEIYLCSKYNVLWGFDKPNSEMPQ